MSQLQKEMKCIANKMEKYITLSAGGLSFIDSYNMRSYDAHHLMQAMSQLQKEVKCIANKMEKYITFSAGGLRFIDSYNFLQGSLESLEEATPDKALKMTAAIAKGCDLLFKKGIYPYEYMDSWEKFGETRLPDKEKIYSKLNDEHLKDEEYEHAQSVWEAFVCKTLGDYHDLYVKTDVALLADVFENFRNLCQEQYGLDPAHYYTSRGLRWNALLKKTGVELQLLTGLEMHLFIERGMRGGIAMVSKRYAKANNPMLPDYDASKPKKIHHVSRREQPLRVGNEQANLEKGFQMETSHAHRGGDP